MIIYFIHSISRCTMGKRNEEHSSNQTIASSFSSVTLARARAARLHLKGTETKDILTNCSQISLISYNKGNSESV